MKTLRLTQMMVGLLLMSCMVASFSSCEKDNLTPEGTISLNMRNSDNGETTISMGNAVIYIYYDNNFHCIINYGASLYSKCEMYDVGKVKGISGIDKNPSTTWTSEVAVVPGHGYIIRLTKTGADGQNSYDYGRIYVLGWTESTDGGIIGAKVEYQYPFVPKS